MPRPASRNPLLAAVILTAVAAAYAPSLRGDFLWDDDLHITANPTIVGPLGLKEIWTTSRANYFPLVLTNFWIQHALWELDPLGYRIVTLLFHAGAALLLWRVLLALRVPGAWLGAALWALHPVQVESVAWICELKNTQSAVFFLAAIWAYVRWILPDIDERKRVGELRRAGTRRYYALTLAFAVLAILSKPSTVMLPVALALCAWWLRRRVEWRDLVALAPFFALSGLAAGWTIWEQKFHSGAIGPEWSQTLAERLALAGRVVWFYLGKLAWPDLIFIYPRWNLDAANPRAYLGSVLVVAALVLLWRARERAMVAPVLLTATYFVALLFPVLGFFSVYFFRYSFVGDHFQYLASMAPLALTGALLTRVPRATPFLGGALLLVLGFMTARQGLVYRNNETLWRDTIAKNPAAIMAWLNLGDTLVQAGRHEEALAKYQHALAVRPDDPHALNDLGNLLVLLGRPAESLPHFERAITLKPDLADAHSNFGNALRAVGRPAEALARFRRAVELEPRHVGARSNLGSQLAEAGDLAEGIVQLREAVRLNPQHAPAHDHLGAALRKLGQSDASIAAHREALRLNPSLAGARANLARALGAAGRGSEALVELQRAVSLAPGSPEAQVNLGVALAQSGRIDDALAHFETAVKLDPNFVLARVNLGTALTSRQRWREAIPHLQAATALQPGHSAAHAQLGVALVNTGQLEDAVPVFERAVRLNSTSAELHENFAQLLRALGRNREALEQFERAAELRRTR